jgi:hypothetical protein
MSLIADDRLVAVATWRNHRFCAWCQRDLGLLSYSSMQPSYGICATCQHAYFADYYVEDTFERTITTGLRQRAMGMDVPA